MKEKKIFSIFNNETMEELALKVEEVDLLEDKIAMCVLIVSHLELDNGLRVGTLDSIPGEGGIFFNSQSIIPRSPEKIDELLNTWSKTSNPNWDGYGRLFSSGAALELEKFLYFLKRIDENCFLELLKRYEKKVRIDTILNYIPAILIIGGFFGSLYLVGYLLD